jgi:anti-anti-sigma regulatory factor
MQASPSSPTTPHVADAIPPNPAGGVAVATTAEGCIFRVTGKATMRQSQALQAVAADALTTAPDARATVDLTGCTYGDSTFLGCLVNLYRKFGKRIGVAGPADRRAALLGPLRLDRILPAADAAPAATSAFVPLPEVGSPADAAALSTHVLECHRRLAEIDGPMQPVFRKLVDALERDAGNAAGATARPT